MLAIMLELLVRSHMDDHFFLQYSHVPHAIWNETTTLSPGLSVVTSGPTRSMTPLLVREDSGARAGRWHRLARKQPLPVE